jgi:hypothetical protein
MRRPFDAVSSQGQGVVGGGVERQPEGSAQITNANTDEDGVGGLQTPLKDPPQPEHDDDPTDWTILGLMTALRGWVGRQAYTRQDRPLLGPRGEDILRDLKAAEMESRITIQYFMSDINLELRHRPDPSARNWLSIPPRTTVFWRGQIGYDETSGQPWYLVYKIHRGVLYSGFVPASYLRPATARPGQVPSVSTDLPTPSPMDLTSFQAELLQIWRKLLTDEERQVYYQPWFELQEEVERLLGLNPSRRSSSEFVIPRGELSDAITNELEEWLNPVWLRLGHPPPAFYGYLGNYPLTSQIRQSLQNLMLYLYEDKGSVSLETWEILGAAFGIPAADAFLQVLNPGIWSPEFPATTESGLPLQMTVLPVSGVYLRPQPEVVTNLEGVPFNGLPQGSQLTATGAYHLLNGPDEQIQALLAVEYAYSNGQIYSGWVPADYLGAQLVSLTPEVQLWEGPFNTFGYEHGIDPWREMGYHTYGQAQFLNLQAIFRNLGWEKWKDFSERHLNLCGQLATMESLNVSLEEGMRVFASLGGKAHILQDPDLGTTAEDLQRFIQALGWQAEIHFGTDNVEPYLSAHQVVVALVASINGRVSRQGTRGHWVHVMALDRIGGRVTFYNPYFNEVQVMAWGDFNSAWAATDEAGITTVAHIFVTAHP